MEDSEFEKLVNQAVHSIPKKFRDKLDNLIITVADQPTSEQLRKLGFRQKNLLLGLYEGVPQIKRGVSYNLAVPDRITLFKKAIENFGQTKEGIIRLIQQTIYHEIAHHFGMDEKEVREVEKKRRNKKI